MSRGTKSTSKLGNVSIVIDGIKFASVLEGKRYSQLKLLEKAGAIRDLTIQPYFVLQPGFEYKGKRIRPITYRADFSYIEGNQHVVEEVKGYPTKLYQLKRKLFIKLHPHIDYRIITKDNV
jgi:hypothetical protein